MSEEEDLGFWRNFVRIVTPSKKQDEKVLFIPPSAPSKVRLKPSEPLVFTKPFVGGQEKPLPPLNLPRRQRRRLQIDAKLDLHGYTQVAALKALTQFINNGYQAGHHCLLVITGKGKPPPGVLKMLVLSALSESSLRSLVIGTTEASPKDGGSGALYVFLRKLK